MVIRKAEKAEYKNIIDFYYQLIDDMKDMEYSPGWKKGIYPDPLEVKKAIELGEMFICEDNQKIVSSMRINHDATQGYEKVSWNVPATKDEVTIIHMLGISPAYQGSGLSKKLVQFVIDKARSENQKAIRLDVLCGNLPADKLYESMGFKFMSTISLYYEDTGLTDYKLYELVL